MTKLPKCSYAARDDVLKYNNLIKLMLFLMGLNDVFQHIRSSLLSRETLPDVKDAFSIIFREDSHRGVAFSSSDFVTKPQISGFVSKTNNWGTNPNLLCKKRRKVGHAVDRCFDLFGYPLEYNKNPGSKPNGFKTFNENFASTSSENGATLSFTSEQIMKLMNLINDVPSGNMQANMAGWIIDSGVNQNMIISTLNMYGIIDISNLNLTVGHPNEYCMNLLSVNKLIRDSRLLGHPSDQVVDVLQSELNFMKDSHVSPCDICHKTKQTRDPFPSSDHKTTSVGELINLDL
nr:hypothetical protein [Tanacetum cinerariifolium]